MNNKIWIIIDHPMQITTAIGLSLYFKNNRGVNLLVSRHPYWRDSDEAIFKNYFDEIHWFPKSGFSWIFPREIAKILYVKRKLKKINISKDDIFVVLSNRVCLEPIVFSVYKNNRRISINPDYLVGDSFGPYVGDDYQEKAISKIWNNFIFPLFGMESIMYCKHKTDKSLYALFYKRGNSAVFKQSFAIKNIEAKNLSDYEIYDLSAYVGFNLENKNEDGNRKSVVFFGDSTVPDSYQINFVNHCLRYIENFFPGCIYFYKPHPNDHGEAQSIELGQFKVYKDKTVAELFYLENSTKIKACFSVASTAIRHSIDSGITGYYFLKLYQNFQNDFYNALLDISAGTPSESFITDFNSAPTSYAIKYDINKVSGSLAKINL